MKILDILDKLSNCNILDKLDSNEGIVIVKNITKGNSFKV